jgi:hypothetical protein
MPFEIEGGVGLTFIRKRLFISRDDLVQVLHEALLVTDDKQVRETVRNFIDSLNDITV